ncbi:MAG: hypothetical protein HW412_1783 [Bacteroidetes bacterium]|nr:hypothetical protein [Bacteroidota bacterium]
MKTVSLSVLSILVLLSTPTAAQYLFSGYVYTGYSLDRPTDSRSIAMGESFVAVPNNPSAITYNPAGLAGIPGISFSYAQRNDNIIDIRNRRYYSFNSTIHTPFVNVGIFYSQFNQGELEVTTESEPDGTGQFILPSDCSYGISIARTFGEFFSTGISIKTLDLSDAILTSRYSTTTVSHPVLFDLGMLFILPLANNEATIAQRVCVGTSYQNIGAGVRVESKPNSPLPPPVGYRVRASESIRAPQFFRLGFSYQCTVIAANTDEPAPLSFLATGEYRNLMNAFDNQNAMRDYWGFGMEATLYEILAVRLGGFGRNEITTGRYGAGLNVPLPRIGIDAPFTLSINYAAVPYQSTIISDSKVVHAFSIELHYGNNIF